MLTAEELCDICGVTPNKRQAWAAEGSLRRRRGFEELDAVELSVYARIRSVVGPKRARAAWTALRSETNELWLANPRELWILIEAHGVQRHAVATRSRQLGQLVEHGRAVHVVELTAVIRAARAAYRDAISIRSAEIGELRALHQSGG